MQLHRQDSHFKNCKPARPNAVNSGQKINARAQTPAYAYAQPLYA